jgi:hypothetical protein
MPDSSTEEKDGIRYKKEQKLKFLKASHIEMIDEALRKVGEFGEVKLVVERGRLRFLVTEKSVDVLKHETTQIEQVD